jgi:hypothetical protein
MYDLFAKGLAQRCAKLLPRHELLSHHGWVVSKRGFAGLFF